MANVRRRQLEGRPSHCLRLTFALADERALRRGVVILGEVIRKRGAVAGRCADRIHI